MGRIVRLLVVAAVLLAGLLGPLLLRTVVASGEGARRGLTWHRQLAQAQAVARAEGKLLLVASTRPGCGLCETFRNETAPRCADALNAVAVGYVYEITRPEDARLDRSLRAHLPTAKLMPLVGFFTPELEWVHGFSGHREAQQFRADVDLATRRRPARLRTTASPAAPRPSLPAQGATGSEPQRAAPRTMSMIERCPPPVARAACPPPPSAPPAEACDPCPGGVCCVPPPEGEDMPYAIPEELDGGPLVSAPPALPAPPVPPAPPVYAPPPTVRRLDTPTPPSRAYAPQPVEAPAPLATQPRAAQPRARDLPVASSSQRPPASDSSAQDEAAGAAAAGRWGQVLRLCVGQRDPRLRALEVEARRWAQGQLEQGLSLVLAGRHDESVATLRSVQTEMGGEPAAVDAARGIDAVETARDVGRLSDPQGVLATALKRNKYEELRGTRWARLFAQG